MGDDANNTSAEQGIEQVQEQQTEQVQEQENFTPATSDDANNVRLVTDEFGNQELEFGTSQLSQEEQDARPNEADNMVDAVENTPEQTAPSAPAVYTNDELVEAMKSGQIDSSRISESQQAMLSALNDAYAARKQQIEEQQKVQQEAIKQQAQITQETFSGIEKRAYDTAVQQSGLPEDVIDTMEFLDDNDERKIAFNNLLAQNRMQMQEEFFYKRFQEKQQMAEFKSNMNTLSEFCRNEMKNEKEYQNILGEIDKQINSERLPEGVARRLRAAEANIAQGRCSKDDAELFKVAYNAMKKEYYQNKFGVSSIPHRTSNPSIEHSTVRSDGKVAYDFNKIGQMDDDSRTAAIEKILAQL